MTQSQLNREIARTTGESIGLIRTMGFSNLIIPRQPKPSHGCNRQTRPTRSSHGINSPYQLRRAA